MKTKKIINTLKAVSDSTRFRVLVLLNEHPAVVEHIKKKLKVEATLLSHHLKILRDAGLVKCKRIGRNKEYWIAKECKTGINCGEFKLDMG